LLVATKLLTAKLHSRYVKESVSESLEWSESDILPPTPQPCILQRMGRVYHWFYRNWSATIKIVYASVIECST